VKRRQFIALLGSAVIAAPGIATAQAKVHRLAILSPGLPTSGMSSDARLLFTALEKYGYVVDQNLIVEGPRRCWRSPTR
jgi:putative tryptophan/tyrosine transport system substrate-binding protein